MGVAFHLSTPACFLRTPYLQAGLPVGANSEVHDD